MLSQISANRCFGGTQYTYEHAAPSTGTNMRFAAFIPPQAANQACPAVIYLSGLTCTEENATVKSGYQRMAAQLGLVIIAPDTSPRGDGVADDARYNLGQGAGFYLDATQAPWAPHFQMESYIIDDLLPLVVEHLPVRRDKIGITGHSMGGHGALTLAMRHPQLFQSLSAFAPISAPSQLEWSQVALQAYLGDNPALWAEHDACALVKSRGWKGEILVDQGTADPFLDSGLRPDLLQAACEEAGQAATIRLQEGYDHSYFFVASFIEDHLRFHAAQLGAS